MQFLGRGGMRAGFCFMKWSCWVARARMVCTLDWQEMMLNVDDCHLLILNSSIKYIQLYCCGHILLISLKLTTRSLVSPKLQKLPEGLSIGRLLHIIESFCWGGVASTQHIYEMKCPSKWLKVISMTLFHRPQAISYCSILYHFW